MSIAAAMQNARTGLDAYTTQLTVAAQNLSSQAVDGFFKQYVLVQDIGYNDTSLPGLPAGEGTHVAPLGVQLGMGVKVSGIYRVFSQTDIIKTEDPFDLAIQGGIGFFKVKLPNGTEAFISAGNFTPGPDGKIVTKIGGYTLDGDITVPQDAESVAINERGEIYVQISGQQAPTKIGDIKIYTFSNPNGLRALGGVVFLKTDASGNEIEKVPGENGAGIIKAGYRQGNNIDAVEVLVQLMKLQHSYEMLIKAINTGDAMQDASNKIGGV